MKRHPFVNTNLIQALEEEINQIEQGQSNVEQAKSIAKVAQRLISLKKFEIEEEEKVLADLFTRIEKLK
jgi:hemerythrin-like domain-containing protein